MGSSRIWTKLLVGIRSKAGNRVLCGALPTAAAVLADPFSTTSTAAVLTASALATPTRYSLCGREQLR